MHYHLAPLLILFLISQEPFKFCFLFCFRDEENWNLEKWINFPKDIRLESCRSWIQIIFVWPYALCVLLSALGICNISKMW